MATYIFELEGCTSQNLPGVEGSLVKIDMCKIYRTARGAYLLQVEAEISPEGQLQAFLAPLKVKPIPATELPSVVLRG